MKSNLANTNNELIRKRRKKRNIRRSIILIMLLIAVAVTLCLKLTYFNVSAVKVANNSILSTEEIINNAKVNLGSNIFYMNLKEIETNVLSNPYIEGAAVKRVFPSTIEITVKEREAVFYGKKDNSYFIIDRNGVVLEERNNIDNMKLTNLLGFDFSKSKLGSVVFGADDRKVEIIGLITELISLNSSDIKIDSVDLSNLGSLNLHCENIVVKLGNSNNLKQKINKAINIIKDNNLISQSGYVDVGFEGDPVYHIEKQEDKE